MARYVLKASDALECAEENIYNGGLLLLYGKALLNQFVGGGTVTMADLIYDRLEECINSKVLRQDTPRTSRTGTFPHRPSRGHGHGRGH